MKKVDDDYVDARDVPYGRVGYQGGEMRVIEIDGKKWYSRLYRESYVELLECETSERETNACEEDLDLRCDATGLVPG